MKGENFDTAMRLLQAKFTSYRGHEAWTIVSELYEHALYPLSDVEGLETVRRLVLTKPWPPDPSSIRAAFAERVAPVPAPMLAWLEVLAKSRIRREVYSHPLIGRAVDALGGMTEGIYVAIRDGGVGATARVQKQFIETFTALAAMWSDEVAEMIEEHGLKACRRDNPQFFLERAGWAVEEGILGEDATPYRERRWIDDRPAIEAAAIPMPDDVRAALMRLGLDLEAPA